MKSTLLPRLAVIGFSVLMLAQTKGINIIPRRDDAKPPAPLEVRAAEAYENGRFIYAQAEALTTKAREGKSASARARLESKAAKRYQTSIARLQDALVLLSAADEQQPAYLHDLYLRLAEAFLATADTVSAHAAVESALELRPGDLATLYASARIALAQSDLGATQSAYLRVAREAQVYGEAWTYVDQLLALMKTHASQPAFASGDAQRAAQFRAWLEEQAALATETVRWSALPDGKN